MWFWLFQQSVGSVEMFFLLQHCSDLYNIYDCTTFTDVLCVCLSCRDWFSCRCSVLWFMSFCSHVLTQLQLFMNVPVKKNKKQSGFLQIYDMGDSSNINTLYHRHSEEKDFGNLHLRWLPCIIKTLLAFVSLKITLNVLNCHQFFIKPHVLITGWSMFA